MTFVILTEDKPDSLALRQATRAAHLEYVDGFLDKLLAAGGLIEDDGTGGTGGLIILDVEDRQSAEDYIANDPFTKAGLFAKVTITRWRKAYFDFQKLI